MKHIRSKRLLTRLAAVLIISQSTLFATILDRIEYKLNRNTRLLEIIENSVLCDASTFITQAEINKASLTSPAGFVISHPGKWKLCGDVNWDAQTPSSFAITVASDNVILDLGKNYIRQNDTTLAGNFAINVGSYSNVAIVNGSILRGSGGGILVDGGASNVAIDNIACDECCYNGSAPIAPIFGFINSWSSAILFNGSPESGIYNVEVTNCKVTKNGLLGTPPVWFLGSISGTTLTTASTPLYPLTPGLALQGTGVLPNTTIVSGSGTSYTVSRSQSVSEEPMAAADLTGMFTPFGIVSSIFTYHTNNVFIKNNIIDGNFGGFASFALTMIFNSVGYAAHNTINDLLTFGLAKGTSLILCNEVLLEDTNTTNITMNVTPLAASPMGHGAEGIKLTGSSNCILRRLTFNGATVQTEVPVELTSPDAYFDCVGSMMDLNNSNILVEDCTAINLHSDGGQVLNNPSYAAGFNHQVIPSPEGPVHYKGCTTSGVTASTGWAYGFGCAPAPANFVTTNITFDNCEAFDIAVTTSAVYSAGFIVNGVNGRVNDCTISDIAGHAAYGIILDTTSAGEATTSTITNNRITRCETAAVIDNTSAQDSLITGNYAALSGSAGSDPNYVNLNAFVPVVLWKPYLTSPAPATPSILDNLDIEN